MYFKILEKANTAEKMKFSIKGFFSKWDRICSFLQISSHLLKKSLMENFIFCAVEGNFTVLVCCALANYYIYAGKNVAYFTQYSVHNFMNLVLMSKSKKKRPKSV